MGEILEFLFTAIFIFYIIRSVLRLISGLFIQDTGGRPQQSPPPHRPHNYGQNPQQGRIKVDYMPQPKKGAIPDNEGDFIDYEEVK